MFDQLVIGTVASDDEYGATVSSRVIKDPPKKKITKTVPFSNATYDFSKINGEIYWDQRELEYELEMLASSYEELEEMKMRFSNWVMNVMEEELHDPFIPDYHFIATYESKEFDDDESGLKTTVKVKFMAYPYKIANAPKKFSVTMEDGTYSKWLPVYNNSSHKVVPIITVTGGMTDIHLNFDEPNSISYYGVGSADGKSETVVIEQFAIKPGESEFLLSTNYAGFVTDKITVEVSFYEEVF